MKVRALMYVDPERGRSKGSLRWVLPYCRPDWPRIAAAMLLFLVDNVIVLVPPVLAGDVIDQVAVHGRADRLIPLCLLIVAVTVAHVSIRYGYQMWMERFGQNVMYRIVSDEYEAIQRLDPAWFRRADVGDLMSRMTSDADAVRHVLSWVSYQLAGSAVMVVAAIGVMASIDWRLALALAVLMPVLFALARALAVHASPRFLAVRNALADLNSLVEEDIEGNRVVAAFAREPYETRRFDERNGAYMARTMDVARNSRRYMPWIDGLGLAMQLITLGLGGLLVIHGDMTLGGLVSFTSFLWMLDGPVRQSGWLINDLQRFGASCGKIRALLEAVPGIVDPHPGAASPAESRRARGGIRFEHAGFAFPDEPDVPVLDDIDFALPAGGTLGILGPTGSGKSTLVELMSRFRDPTSGRVLVDGVDTRDWPLTALRRSVCVVAQDVFLFSDTIANNIRFGADGDVDDEAIRRAARMAGIDDFVESLPAGYDTVVGERGVGLSGGQRQRLSLARAIAADPEVLVMDDTTSAVDMETEAVIQRNLRSLAGGRTTVTIASRISSVRDADLILVLDHGRIVQRGAHDTLMAVDGPYRRTYDAQLGGTGTGVPEGVTTPDSATVPASPRIAKEGR